jgi:hypothetical protein
VPESLHRFVPRDHGSSRRFPSASLAWSSLSTSASAEQLMATPDWARGLIGVVLAGVAVKVLTWSFSDYVDDAATEMCLQVVGWPHCCDATLAAVAAVLDDAEVTRRSDARSHRRNWTTVAVMPCPPGWRIVYDICDIGDDDDAADYTIRPCPAILLQELRTTSAYIVAESEVETIKHEPPYETRAVFADHEDGVLRPVDEVSNFVCALGPGEDGPPKSSHPSRHPHPRRQA